MLFNNYQAAIDQIGLSNIDKGFSEQNIRDLFQLKVKGVKALLGLQKP